MIGVSNFEPAEPQNILDHGTVKPVVDYDRTLSGPEHRQVRLPTIEKLVKAG